MIYNENHVLRTTLVLSLALCFIGLIWKIQIGLGFLFGGLISVLAFKLLILSSTKLLQEAKLREVTPKQAKRHNWKGFLTRCTLYGAALGIGVKSPYLSFFSTFCGLLLPRLAIYYHQIRGRSKGGT